MSKRESNEWVLRSLLYIALVWDGCMLLIQIMSGCWYVIIDIVGWNVAAGMDGHKLFMGKNSLQAVGKKLEAGVFNLTSSADWFKECMVWKNVIENDSKTHSFTN